MDYYDSDDLKKFSEVGKFSKDLMDKFFDYYNSAINSDGALTKREKSLIALAIAHSTRKHHQKEATGKGKSFGLTHHLIKTCHQTLPRYSYN